MDAFRGGGGKPWRSWVGEGDDVVQALEDLTRRLPPRPATLGALVFSEPGWEAMRKAVPSEPPAAGPPGAFPVPDLSAVPVFTWETEDELLELLRRLRRTLPAGATVGIVAVGTAEEEAAARVEFRLHKEGG